METVTVTHLIAGTVVEDVHTGERITCQQFADGRALIKVYRGGKVAEYVTYRQAERTHRIVTAEHLELP